MGRNIYTLSAEKADLFRFGLDQATVLNGPKIVPPKKKIPDGPCADRPGC